MLKQGTKSCKEQELRSYFGVKGQFKNKSIKRLVTWYYQEVKVKNTNFHYSIFPSGKSALEAKERS